MTDTVSETLQALGNEYSPKKIRVLFYGDFLKATGFGNVSMAIIERLLKTGKYYFEVLGINYGGDPSNDYLSRYYKFKNVPVWPTVNPHELRGGLDLFGKNRLIKLLVQRPFDIFFSIQDSFNMTWLHEHLPKIQGNKQFKYVFYFPVDGDLHPEWISRSVKTANIPVTYTDYGVESVKKVDNTLNVQKIYHGIDMDIFKPFATEQERQNFRKELFEKEDAFVFLNVNRNQPRKDMARTCIAFAEFVRKNPDANVLLYFNTHVNDAYGVNLIDVIKGYLPKSTMEKIKFTSQDLLAEDGCPPEVLGKIYAASDCLLTTSLGEGWGLSTTEAMASKTPVLVPEHTSFVEIIGKDEERGYFIPKSGEFVILTNDNGLKRPLVSVDKMVEKMEYIYTHRDEAKAKAEKAYEWCKGFVWDKIAEQWDAIFTEAHKSLNN